MLNVAQNDGTSIVTVENHFEHDHVCETPMPPQHLLFFQELRF